MSRRLTLAGQAGVVLLLALALWDPALDGRGPVHLTVLLDDSDSMTRAGTDAAWLALAPVLAGLPGGSRVSLVRFAAGTAPEAVSLPADGRAVRALAAAPPPRERPLDGGQTDLAAALRAGLALGADPAPVLLVAGDGVATRGDARAALETAAAAGVPVRWWRPRTPAQSADAWIAALDLPPRLAAGTPAVVGLRLGADGPLSAVLTVRAAGVVLARRELELAAGTPALLTLTLDLPDPGLHRVEAELTPGGRVPGNDHRSALVEREGPAAVLLAAPDPGASAVASSLAAGGWPVRAVAPGDLPAALAGEPRLLILEQMAVADLPEADWAAVARAVRGGSGLLVLGGPGTFAAGGYRHSTLEGLLPVLAEAPRPQTPAAVVFAVDGSGSMARADAAGVPRHTLARRAVAGAARSLAPSDAAALVVFGPQARTLLPLAPRADQAAAVVAAWDPRPGGGTRIAPALEAALRLLAGREAPERLLVLASDGRFADPEQVPGLAGRLAAAGVSVVAIAVGGEADTTALGQLAAGRGRLLRAADALELPVLMQTEVQARRAGLRPGPVTPRVLHPLPFPARTDPWPTLAALQVTRPRDGAQVYLAADGGEPILAAAFAGAGRVVAMPAGLGPWATDWTAWAGWGAFLGSLVQWAAGTADGAPDLRVVDGPDGPRLLIEAVDAAGDWVGPGPMPVAARDPAGSWHRIAARAQAAGRWTAPFPAGPPGRWDLIAGPPGRERRLALVHEPLEELIPDPARPDLGPLVAEGLVEGWSPGLPLPAPARAAGTRPWLAGLALGLFLLVIVAERLPAPRPRGRAHDPDAAGAAAEPVFSRVHPRTRSD